MFSGRITVEVAVAVAIGIIQLNKVSDTLKTAQAVTQQARLSSQFVALMKTQDRSQ